MTVNNFSANRAVISLSGGLDSTCLLLHLLSQGLEVRAYSFYYGQKHDIELKKVKNNIAFLQKKGYPVTHQIINLEDCFSDSASSLHQGGEAIPEGHYADENMKSTVVENRNIIFSSIIYGKALGWANKTNENVFITQGLHAGDHCFTGDTKILTPDGLKTISELKEGDAVYSFNGDKLKTEIDRCVDIIEKGTNNEIYNITTTSGTIRLTGKHKVYVVDRTNLTSKGYDKVFSHKLAEELKEGDIMITSDKLPDSSSDNKAKEEYIDIEDILYNFIKEKFPEYSINKIDGKLGIVSANGKITSMSALMQTAENGSQNKCIPQWIMNFLKNHKEYINDFLDVLICGDGHYDKTTGMYSYSTKSHKLAEDIAFLVKLSGQYVKSTVSKYDQYIIMFGSNRRKHGLVRFGDAAMTTITKIEKENKLEKVYDISVEKNHNFFAGEYGNVLISNSIYPDCRPESQEMARELYRISNWGSERVDFIAPFIHIDKGDVLAAGLKAMEEMGFSFDEKNEVLRNTHTCYNPNEKGESCGRCGSCTERLEAFEKNGWVDPIPYQK